ncbi:hypothetical protein BDC45DRAFT_541852 [Circinella umbellata]|nr:hypothetical protein BDC45DRAFT_541852 [Circinella umbellata]
MSKISNKDHFKSFLVRKVGEAFTTIIKPIRSSSIMSSQSSYMPQSENKLSDNELSSSSDTTNNWSDSQRLAYALANMPSEIAFFTDQIGSDDRAIRICIHICGCGCGYGCSDADADADRMETVLSSFQGKYCKQIDLSKTVEKLWLLRMENPYLRLYDYIHCFDELKMHYERGIQERENEFKSENSELSKTPAFLTELFITHTTFEDIPNESKFLFRASVKQRILNWRQC